MKPSVKLAAFPFFRETKRLDNAAVGGPLKRSFDIVVATLGLFILSPLFIMLGFLIKMSDGGPVFYGHRRIGCGGQPFYCLKFRTMKTDGDAILESFLRENPQARQEWQTARKLQSDPRVTDVGAVIRKLSLDELPQLLNILRGEMSIVGPRPVVLEELELYGPAAAYYLRSRPGLTGVWQISGRNNVSYDKRVAFDQRYVENWSFRGDVAIILKTIPAVCAARGSY
ncbi:sugar transferase [Phyllobacterium zundukense]|uniref:Exopolysaccharide biosynthesis protein n=1 Tax=Phyllobacterium zundukense TaxID=1867719 RepID=A0A2N9VQT1_9HYPH|nr:sugar transferase [Phyllobacterium zundukense]ATU92285.1 exopolysaccharide biosynthesis protein [Phyllobacterium zundukense]PIO41849.1 exopolysaccharide biosynthesis protein [Phyllobacterium zundukense]